MKISVLVENTTRSSELKSEHGLSLYIEVKGKKLLFDTGASGLFLENAKKMNLNIKAVDTLVISHGHNDHGGGLKTFLDENKSANCLIGSGAFRKRENGKGEFRGLDVSLKDRTRDIPEAFFSIGDGIYLFNLNSVKTKIPVDKYYAYEGNTKVKDDFRDEYYMVIIDNGHTVLFSGCAHRGIDIVLTYINQELANKKLPLIDVVVGGLHTKGLINEGDPYFNKILNLIKNEDIHFYLGHCTGEKEYKVIKDNNKDKVDALYCGRIIKI